MVSVVRALECPASLAISSPATPDSDMTEMNVCRKFPRCPDALDARFLAQRPEVTPDVRGVQRCARARDEHQFRVLPHNTPLPIDGAGGLVGSTEATRM